MMFGNRPSKTMTQYKRNVKQVLEEVKKLSINVSLRPEKKLLILDLDCGEQRLTKTDIAKC
jgi:hypothetical protein